MQFWSLYIELLCGRETECSDFKKKKPPPKKNNILNYLN